MDKNTVPTDNDGQPLNLRTELGRIQSVRMGHGGYQDAQFGIAFMLGSKSNTWGVSDFWGFWSPALIEHGPNHQWTELERQIELANTCTRIAALLKEADVNDVMKLVNKPIEATFRDYNMLHSWRLLIEVL